MVNVVLPGTVTVAMMRIAVAMEAIRLSDLPGLEVQSGTFIHYHRPDVGGETVEAEKLTAETELQTLIRETTWAAEGGHTASRVNNIGFCAVGGACMGFASLYDNLPLGELDMGLGGAYGYSEGYEAQGTGIEALSVVEQVFGIETAHAMEAAFEHGHGAIKLKTGSHEHDSECYAQHEHTEDCRHECECSLEGCSQSNEYVCDEENSDPELICTEDEDEEGEVYVDGRGIDGDESVLTLEQYHEAVEFGIAHGASRSANARERFVAIMQRIVDNGGAFFVQPVVQVKVEQPVILDTFAVSIEPVGDDEDCQ